LKKIILYSTFAAILGIVLIIVPLLTIKTENMGNFYFARSIESQGTDFQDIVAGYGLVNTHFISAIGSLTLSFLVAIGVYVIARRKTSSH
jgi:uncharacterized membrane protein